MSRRLGLEQRRILAIVVVLALLAGAGIANASVRAARNRAASARPVLDSVVKLSGPTESDAWYCAGPLPVGARPGASSIAVANVGTARLAGDLVVTLASGSTTRTRIAVVAHTQIVVGLTRTGPPTFAAVTVLLDGVGAGVSEVVHGTGGVTTSACVDHTAPTQYIAAGSSKGANNLTLALYDPGATPAVASVSFADSTSVVAPPAFQGLPVPAGAIVVLDVGHYLPQRQSFSTTVTSVGGWIVAGSLTSVIVSHTLYASLVDSSSGAASTWYFAPTPAGTSVHEDFTIANPNATSANVLLRLGGAGGVISETAVIPPRASTELSAVPALSRQSLRYAEVSTAPSTPVVVERETLVSDVIPPSPEPKATKAPTQHPRTNGPASGLALLRLLGLTPGYALSAPVEQPVERWLIPGGESDARVGEAVLVANPSAAPVTVEIATFPDVRPGAPALVREVVAAQSAVVIDAGAVSGEVKSLPLTVVASAPVVVGGLLYERGSSGLSGFSASIAIPED